MKKIIVLFVIMLFVVGWKSTKVYQEYKGARAMAIEAESESNYVVAAEKYLLAASVAEDNNMLEIQAWQLNNAAYCLIKNHKLNKDVSGLLNAIDTLTAAKEIADKINVENLNAKIKSNIDYCKFYIK